jgi:hypothetical protein
MHRFTILMTLAALATSLTTVSHPSFAFGLHMPRIHMPHVPRPTIPPNPYGQPGWGR